MSFRVSKLTAFLIVEHVFIACVVIFSIHNNPFVYVTKEDEALPFDQGDTETVMDRSTLEPVVLQMNRGKTNVLRFNGTKLEQLHNFCAYTQPFPCAQLNTPQGKMPIFVHDPDDDPQSKKLLQTGDRDPENVALIMSEIRRVPGSTFFDIGSNLGVYALTVASNLHVPTIAMDPVFQNMARLCKSVQKNNLTNNVTLVLNAASDTHSKLGIKIFKGTFGHTRVVAADSLTSESACSKHTSFSVKLDDLLPYVKTKSAVFKIDVESHEYHAIRGGDMLFKKIDVPAVLMEWDPVSRTPHAKDLLNMMKNYGFFPYTTRYQPLSYDKAFPPKMMDVLWLKRKL